METTQRETREASRRWGFTYSDPEIQQPLELGGKEAVGNTLTTINDIAKTARNATSFSSIWHICGSRPISSGSRQTAPQPFKPGQCPGVSRDALEGAV